MNALVKAYFVKLIVDSVEIDFGFETGDGHINILLPWNFFK